MDAAVLYGEVVVLTHPDWQEQVSAAVGDLGVAPVRVEVIGTGDGELGSSRTARSDAGGTASSEAGRSDIGGSASSAGERSGGAAALRAVAGVMAAAAAAGPVTLLEGHLVADPVGIVPLLDEHGGTTALTGPVLWEANRAEVGARAGVASAAHAGAEVGTHADGESAAHAGAGTPGAPVRTIRGRVVAVGTSVHALGSPTEALAGAVQVTPGHLATSAAALRELADAHRDGALHLEVTDVLGAVVLGLVRSGAAVAARPVARGGLATVVRTPVEAAAAVARVAALDPERLRREQAVKAEDGFFTTFLVSSWSPALAALAARLGLSPDAVTWLSMLAGVLAALAFAVGTLPFAVVGALLLQWAFVLDCVDGQLARYTRRFSARGAWLDAIFDRGKEYVVYAGLAAGGVRAGGDAGVWLLAGAALALQTFRHTLDLGYAAQQAADVERTVRRPLLDTADAGPGFWEVGHATSAGRSGEVAGDGEAVGGGEVAAGAGGGGRGSGEGPGDGEVAAGAGGLPRRVILALRAAEGVPALKWAKRIVVLPIGERFALLSVLAVTTSPRTTFVVLLTWSALATLYTAGGRIVRSVA